MPKRSIRGAGGDKKSKNAASVTQRPPQESPNTLRSRNVARIIDLLCEGPIQGLVNGDRSVFIDGTPLRNPDGTYNFKGISLSVRNGTPDQEHFDGFPAVESEFPVGVEVTTGSPVVRTITDPETNAVRVKIRFPQMTFQNLDTGDLVGTAVEVAIDRQNNGGSWVPVVQTTVTGKSTSPYETSYLINLPPGGHPWNIRVRRTSPNSGSVNLQNDMFWSTYTQIINAKLSYPDTALISARVDASEFGTDIPPRAYEINGLLLRVPNNYNPTTREYTGIWDGGFQVAWSDNPAWALYEILTNERFGLGEEIDPDNVDKFTLYEIAQYCDELVPNGLGGMEPRFTFNAVLESREEAYDVVNAITAGFRGMAYWAGGAILASQDKPGDPVKLVTPANVVGGEFNYSGTALKARHSVALVSWNDPEDGYKPAIAIVEDPEMIQQFGWRQLDVVAVGCTSRGQAVRYGRWLLDSEKNETETVTYRAGLDHMDLRPGDLIAVADPSYAAVRRGGRILEPGDTSIKIDESIEIVEGETYTVSIVLPDGTVAERQLTNTPGTTDTLTWADALAVQPIAGAMWVVTGTDVAPRLFRVVAMKEVDKTQYEVTATFHDPTKYARVEQNLVVERPNYTQLPSGPLRAPTNITFLEYLYQAGPAVKSAMTVSWSFSTDVRISEYEIEIKGPDSPDYTYLTTTTGNSIDVMDVVAGVYNVRVRGVEGSTNRKSPYALGTYETQALLAPPGDVENFAINVVGEHALLTWAPVPDLDLSHYVLKFSNAMVGATWGSSVLVTNEIGKNQTSITVPAAIGSYLIKAIDTSGKESVNASIITTNIAKLANLNVIELLTESPTFAGEKVDCVLIGDGLRLSGADSIDDWANIDEVQNIDIGESGIEDFGIYYFAQDFDLGATYTSRLIPNINVFGSDLQSNIVDLWTNIDQVENIDGADPSSWGVELQVRTTTDDPEDSPTWTAWTPLFLGDYTARAFEFRLLLYSYQAGISPVVEDLSVEIDMPDRIESENDITCPPEGLAVVYDPAFKDAPAVAVSAQGMATGDYYELTGKSSAGFTIRFFNSSGVGIERTFDWVAQGYGVQN
jgi:predicted phage tail protein